MPKKTYPIDPANLQTTDPLIEATHAGGTPFEAAIRAAAGLHERPFNVFIDYLNRLPEVSPMFDQFTFDMDTDDLIVLSDEPQVMVDALIEMAMFMRGFNTLMGVEPDWKIRLAIGGWRAVRESLKQQLGLPHITGRIWTVSIDPDSVADFNEASFTLAVALAGCPDVDVQFPKGTPRQLRRAYKYLARIVELLGMGITLSDRVKFNQRLGRAVSLIDDHMAPKDDAALDDDSSDDQTLDFRDLFDSPN